MAGTTELGPPDAATRAAIADLAAAAGAVDGREPFTEQTRLVLAQSADAAGVVHAVRRDGTGRVVGYAQRDAAGTTELAVHPDARRAGHGHALLTALPGAPALRVWAHGPHPAAGPLAAAVGLTPVRELWRMRRPLPLDPDADPPGPVPLPDGVRVRTFEVGRDEDAWLALNATAFAAHGEQGRLTRADLDARIATDWFSAAGFFLAERSEPGGVRLVGFHWTKIHPAAGAEPAAGEIYVLGVDPGEQGNGLGRSLSRIGLRHLADQSLGSVLLYVDADNTSAVAVYTRLGFRTEAVSVMYAAAETV
ncbi:mycothiol synthase [Sporichthya brevicatena]|uniref:Mycothiol acetyltransferase n=1 Tax=Sporichthya brevicatena TaxID=171442 RepID=A0ABP3RPH8_9ACTN